MCNYKSQDRKYIMEADTTCYGDRELLLLNNLCNNANN